MPSLFSASIKHFPPGEIIIPPDRQRSGGDAIDTSDIEPSILKRGIIHPIVIKRDMTLVAGERRLRASLKLKLPKIPTRFFESLSLREAKIIELEENEKRKDLEWRDHVKALIDLHSLYTAEALDKSEAWSLERTGEMLNYSAQHLSKCKRVHKDLANPKIANAPGMLAAYNILMRLDERAIGDVMSGLAETAQSFAPAPRAPAPAPADISTESIGLEGKPQGKPMAPPPAKPESILHESFLDWVLAYSGPRFNFLHCDFPYGANLFGGPQSGRDKWSTYDDNPDVYWELIRVFCRERDRFMATSMHMMFWFDMDFYSETLELFGKLAPEISFIKKPMIWTKSDNVGILSDPKRRPRHIYETCLVASRGDRYVIQAVSDSYACPTDKAHHPSTKPEPMLRNFMRMFVDENTEMLDPTCGSGSALRAAESLGASRVIGLERDGEFAEAARSALRQSRAKAKMSKGI